jgi:hypothetical protein
MYFIIDISTHHSSDNKYQVRTYVPLLLLLCLLSEALNKWMEIGERVWNNDGRTMENLLFIFYSAAIGALPGTIIGATRYRHRKGANAVCPVCGHKVALRGN